MASESPYRSLHALSPGTVLHDYVIDSELGSGGFSMVYLARHRLNAEWLFAIKEYLPRELVVRDKNGTSVHPVDGEAGDAFEDGLRRFRHEASQLRRFRNERHIVSCLNYFEANGTAYLVMDYDDGLPLSEFLRRREAAGQPFTEADLRAVVEPLLGGLEVVHRAGVLHRDIKPGNIFVRRSDDIGGRPAEPVLIDFGAAKQNYLARHSRSLAPYTPGYAAYEQMSSEGDIGPWTDLYAVGALMWRMVAGGCPGDPRLDAPDEMTGRTKWNPTPRAVERRSYALLSKKPDPMVPAIELGAGRFSPHLLGAIDACLALIPQNRVQSTEQLSKLIEGQESSHPADGEEVAQSEISTDVRTAASSAQPSDHGDAATFIRRAASTGAWNKARSVWRMLAGRLKWYGRRESMISGRGSVRKNVDVPLVEHRGAGFLRMPTARTLGITVSILTAISLVSTVLLRVPLALDREPLWSGNNVLGAAMREHGVLLNLTVFASEQLVFSEDPQFDKIEAKRSDLDLESYFAFLRRIGDVETLREASSTDYLLERANADTQLALARSLAEYGYLKRKATMSRKDTGILWRWDIFGTLIAIAVVFTDPIGFIAAWALFSLALRKGMLAPQFGGFRSAMIGALICGSILAVQQSTLFSLDNMRTERTIYESVGTIVVGTALCSFVFGAFGAFARRRTHQEFAARQDASIRVGLVAGLAAPILQLVLQRLGAANDLDGPQMLSLVFCSFVLVAVFHSILGGIGLFANRKSWIVWLFVPGELLAHSILDQRDGFFDSAFYNDGYVAAVYLFNVIALPLFWIPSALILTLALGFFEKQNSWVVSGTVLRPALLLMVGILTWIVIGDLYGVPSGGGSWF